MPSKKWKPGMPESYGSPEFKKWCSMRRRCNDRSLKNYGGRGITVCERWLTYENFLADMGRMPTPKHQVERIDNDKGYEPDNCKWATNKENTNNTRRNVTITYQGRTQTVAQWADELGIPYATIKNRRKWGWPVAQMLSNRRYNAHDRLAELEATDKGD